MDFVHPDDKDTVLGWHHKEGGEFSGEYRILKPDGTVRWISASLFHVKEESIHDEKPRRILEKARERRVLHEGREIRFTFSCGISDSRSCEAGKCTLEGLGTRRMRGCTKQNLPAATGCCNYRVQEGQPISLEPFYTTYHLGVLEGYSYGDAIDAIPENRKHRYPTQESLLEAVAEGKEAYGVFDRGVRGYLQQHMGIDGVMPLPGMDFLRPLAVMFHKSDTTLRDAFNTGLRSIRDKGLYDKIMQSWKQG